jgi:hypothetical protein
MPKFDKIEDYRDIHLHRYEKELKKLQETLKQFIEDQKTGGTETGRTCTLMERFEKKCPWIFNWRTLVESKQSAQMLETQEKLKFNLNYFRNDREAWR